ICDLLAAMRSRDARIGVFVPIGVAVCAIGQTIGPQKIIKLEIAVNPSPINIGGYMNMMKLVQPSSALSERLLRWPLRAIFTPVLAICLCLLAGGALAALAQTTGSATLRGIVKDPTGAVVSGAQVTMKSVRTQSERKVKSSSDGIYV